MAEHNELGKAGEEAAAHYLSTQGYTIRQRNWHRGHLEIDIIAQKADTMAFVEVKTRKCGSLEAPEVSVNNEKVRNLVRAADYYIKAHQIDADIRFDIITAIGDKTHFEINHIEDAFYPPLF